MAIMLKNKHVFTLLVLVILIVSKSASARDQIQIVGSSTVFPFSTAVAEQFGQKTSFKTPVVESTGSGGGLKLFCSGIGEETPDITNASRRIKEREFNKCIQNGATPVEIKVGFDGIVMSSAKEGIVLNLTHLQIFNALAKKVVVDGELKDNPHRLWSDVDSSLPSVRIEVLGPPPTSGTRDAFVELVFENGAKNVEMLSAIRKRDKKAFEKIAHAIREDGAYVETGENDNLIIQKIKANPSAVGILGFSFFDQNSDKIKGASIAGIQPTFDNIASGDYPISRSLYFYVKKEHVGIVPGIEEYISEFTNEETWGDEGYLAEKGLIPLPKADREIIAKKALSFEPLIM
ncbi:substrate-binding domain-containing protein [Candidatus Endowatersipora endosymbiont of Watersipora subatra]|uniref:substrate-binding domain-containing protein n=1 Tax=Candidatus Endowatersipora endosymbiont of Watersipora subatra TaxID=3077946 RepID=UPI00312C6C97